MRILLVDDHALFRIGVRHALGRETGYDVVGEESTARGALRALDSLSPDVVLMDIVLPGMDGVVATREMCRRAPQVQVLVITAYELVTQARDALAAGAVGFLLKSDGPEALVAALATIRAGRRYVSPTLRPRLDASEAESVASDHVLDALSLREREIFRLAARCLLARDIATELCVSRKTVDSHLYHINRKLGLRNLAELVRFAAALRLFGSPRRSCSVHLGEDVG
jgi:DNA-binding NarL/FixJ family response regulator